MADVIYRFVLAALAIDKTFIRHNVLPSKNEFMPLYSPVKFKNKSDEDGNLRTANLKSSCNSSY